MAAQHVLASSLRELPNEAHDSAAGTEPGLHELLADARWQEGPAAIGPERPVGSRPGCAAPLHWDLETIGGKKVFAAYHFQHLFQHGLQGLNGQAFG